MAKIYIADSFQGGAFTGSLSGTATSASYASNTSETLSTVTGRGATTTTSITTGPILTVKGSNPYIQWHNASGTRLGYIQHATNLVISTDTGNIELTPNSSLVNITGNITTTGIISAGATSGFANSTYAVGVRNPIWRFGNESAYGISYFQGTSGDSGLDTIGFHFGTATASGSPFWIRSDGYVRSTYQQSTGYTSAPIFYDLDNTGYYLDPASTSNLVGLTVANTITGNISGNAGGNAASATSAGLVSRVGSASDVNTMFGDTTAGYLGWNDAYNPTNGGFSTEWANYLNMRHENASSQYGSQLAINWSGTTAIKYRTVYATSWSSWKTVLDSSNYSTYSSFSGAVYGTIYYDANNSGYYLDPASTSKLNNVSFDGGCGWFGGYGPGSGPGLAFENQTTFARMAFWGLDFYDWDSGIQMTLDSGYVNVNNYLQAGNSLRAPIFYDSNDTGYYVNPSSASNLNTITTAGYVSIGGSVYLANGNYMYFDSGVSNDYGIRKTSTSLAFTSAGNFTFNKPVSVTVATTGGDINITSGTVVGKLGASSDAAGIYIGAQSNNNVYFQSNNTTRATLTAGGSLVVGATSTSYTFHVAGGQYGTYLKGGDSGTGSDILRLVNVFGDTKYLARGDGKHYFTGDTDVQGTLTVSNNFTAPIFYDLNDTAYYLDPANADVSAVLKGTVTIGGGTGGNYDEGLRIIDSGGFSVIAFGASGNAGAGRFNLLKNSSDAFELRNASGGQIWWTNQSGNTVFNTDVRSPIFYDYNNTGYYLDPAGSSNVSTLTADSQGIFIKNNTYYCTTYAGAGNLQPYSTSNYSAYISFHKAGYYGLNMGLDADNVLRIGGFTASSNRFQMDMSGNLTMAGDVTAYSDRRVKENITTVDNALEKVNNLRGVYYNRIDSEDKRTKLGVIAQEILEIVPEVVSQDNDGMYNVSYGNLAGLFIEAIKEQQTQIEELKQLVNQLINK